MKQDKEPKTVLEIPVGVSLTHDKGHPIIFAYVGGKGPLGMRAKRFNPRVLGSLERALKQAIRWRKQALREHNAAVAALPPREERKAAAPARTVRTQKAAAAVRPARGQQKAAAAVRPAAGQQKASVRARRKC